MAAREHTCSIMTIFKNFALTASGDPFVLTEKAVNRGLMCYFIERVPDLFWIFVNKYVL